MVPTVVTVKAEEETNGAEKAESAAADDASRDQESTVRDNSGSAALETSESTVPGNSDNEADEESMDGTDTESVDNGSSRRKKMVRRCLHLSLFCVERFLWFFCL